MNETRFKRPRLFKRQSKLYPQAYTCIGAKAGHFHGREWWYATGEAKDRFKTIESDILEQLKGVFSDSYCSIVHFQLYMIGHCEQTAVPTIMFFCEEKEPRKKAKNAIDDGGLLEGLPGFRTGHQTKQPNIGKLVMPATGGESPHGIPSHSPVDVYFDPSRDIRAFGMPIFVKHSNTNIRQATANAIFNERQISYLSVSHIFCDNFPNASENKSDYDSDYDLGSNGDSDDEESDKECFDAILRASMSSPEDTVGTQSSGEGSPLSGSSATTNDASPTQPG